MNYAQFLESKSLLPKFDGIESHSINPMLFDFQRDITAWALRRGRACVFADCGLGKTPIQLQWCANVPGKKLILAPLCVAQQTVSEGEKFGVRVKYVRGRSEIDGDISITNYELLEHFDLSEFSGVVCDESSILKHYDGKTRNRIIEGCRTVPYRLACTATPSPNDFMELGNHAEFVGAMTRTEMLSMFFVHDGGDTSKWRIKGHARREFWRWVCSWAVMMRKPSDLGYDDGAFILPALALEQVTVASKIPDGSWLPAIAGTLQERIAARRGSIDERVAVLAERVNRSDESWVIWCNLNAEADEAERAIRGAVQVTGSEKPEAKERKAKMFASGEIKKLVTKPDIFGFGLNWQHCHNVAFLGLSDSWESYYQAVRRCWRFGQTKIVNCLIVTSEAEGAVVKNIERKEADADRMAVEMVNNMHELNESNIKGTAQTRDTYTEDFSSGPNWELFLGDCVDVLRKTPYEHIDYAIFSPPFASLYTYSASDRDMGNCKNYEEFSQHFEFMVRELYRVMLSGRNVSVHCMDLPTTKSHHGYIGLQDFRGDIIRLFERVGFIYHSSVCIWKDPVTAMQRTKALGLLWKQLKKDSTMSRQGVPDYLVTFRKPGDNPVPVAHSAEEFPVTQWQQWASPVWTDINPSDTLQRESAREDEDERHICPLQLEVIKRAIVLWSNPGDLVLSPFAGIGSEGFVALQNNRKFVGIELKRSYWEQARANLERAAQLANELTIFGKAV